MPCVYRLQIVSAHPVSSASLDKLCILEEFSSNELGENMKLIEIFQSSIVDLLHTDIMRGLLTVSLLVEGNSQIQSVLTECSSELFHLILVTLKSKRNFDAKLFHVSIKALYAILMCCLPDCAITLSQQKDLKNLMDELEMYIMSDELTAEVGLIVTSSIVLIISYIDSRPLFCFTQILNRVCSNSKKNHEKSYVDRGYSSQYCESLHHDMPMPETCEGSNKSYSNHISSFIINNPLKPCFSSLLLIHGILNVKPSWFLKMNQGLIGGGDHKKYILEYLCSSCFFHLWPFIKIHCKVLRYSHYAIQVLHLWLQTLHNFIKDNLKETEIQMPTSCLKKYNSHFSEINSDEHITNFHDINEIKVNHLEEKSDCILCSHIQVKHLFSMKENSSGDIFQLLNFMFENQSKGVASLMVLCYKELLNIHDCFLSGHSTISTTRILDNVLKISTLYSKGTLLHLHIGFDILSPHQVLQSHDSIPINMCVCLKNNKLAALATSVFRFLATKLGTVDWFFHFKSTHQYCVKTEDTVLWQNYKTLWLPIIVSHHPRVLMDLLHLSNAGNHEWEANVILLRLCRLNGLISVSDQTMDSHFCEYIFANNEIYGIKVHFQFEHIPVEDHKGLFNANSFIVNCLLHANENIRMEAFAFLCVTKKTTLPLHKCEIILLKRFFILNMNIDSQRFRQSILKSFQILICRIRDSCSQALKKIRVSGSRKDLLTQELNLNEEIVSSFNFLIWIIHKLHDDLSLLGNYSRHITALSLYTTIINIFFHDCNHSNDVCKRNDDRYSLTRYMLHILSKKLSKDDSEIITTTLTSSETVSVLLTCCTHEMSDVREKASDLLLLLYKLGMKKCISESISSQHEMDASCQTMDLKKSLQDHGTILGSWTSLALKLVESPKANEMESGAILIKIITTVGDKESIESLIHKNVETASNGCYFENVIRSFLLKMKIQFEEAQVNILTCSSHTTVAGTILVLTTCLTECHVQWNPTFVADILSSLSFLYQEMVRFVLTSLASSPDYGTNGPPSFAEMGSSIDSIIEKHESKDMKCQFANDAVSIHARKSDPWKGYQNETRTNRHQMVLAFFWRLLKMCCWSSAKLIHKFFNVMEETIFDRFLGDVVVRVLTGTRHKGAMESAQDALALITQSTFERVNHTNIVPSRRADIVMEQVWSVLSAMESSFKGIKRTSTTRRAGGLSMLFVSVCGHLPYPKQASFIHDIIRRLITVAHVQIDVTTNSGEVDLIPALSLHILHSMILSSKLTSASSEHLSAISILCLKNFASEVWSIRNAALQLFGAIIPRLLGQKKIKEDTTTLNSISAVEFCHSNPLLIAVILESLRNYAKEIVKLNNDGSFFHHFPGPSKAEGHTKERKYNEVVSDHSKIKNSNDSTSYSSLVPILSLLARLNPGSVIQQNYSIKLILELVVDSLFVFLNCPVYTVRRLASLAIVAFSKTRATVKTSLKTAIDLLSNSMIDERTNLTHGCLLLITNMLSVHLDIIQKNVSLINKVTSCLIMTLAKSGCHLNQTLVFTILKDLKSQPCVTSIFLSDEIPTQMDTLLNWSIGVNTFDCKSFMKIGIQNNKTEEDIKCYTQFLWGDSQDLVEETYQFIIQDLKLSPNSEKYSVLQKYLWLHLNNVNLKNTKCSWKLSRTLQLLTSLLEIHTVDVEFAMICVPGFHQFLTPHALDLSSIFMIVILSHLIINNNLKPHFSPTLIRNWANAVLRFSEPRISEECRMCSCKALCIAIEDVLHSYVLSHDVVFPLLKASFNILYDEENEVRLWSSLIAKPFQKCRDLDFSPAVASYILINHVLKLAIQMRCAHSVKLLWRVCFEYNLKPISCSQNCFPDNLVSLFESSCDNAYREPQDLAIVVNDLFQSFDVQHCDSFKDSMFEVEQFICSKTEEINGLKSILPSVLSANERIDRSIVHKIAIVKNGLRFLRNMNCLLVINKGT